MLIKLATAYLAHQVSPKTPQIPPNAMLHHRLHPMGRYALMDHLATAEHVHLALPSARLVMEERRITVSYVVRAKSP